MLMNKNYISNGISRLLQKTIVSDMEIDDTIKELLTYIIYNEPITLYRISKNTRFAVSTIYKKAKRMIQYGLIRPLNDDEFGGERCVYVSTVKGLLTCLAINCIDDPGIVISRLCQRWHLKSYCCQRAMKILSVMPVLLGIDSNALRMIEDPRAIMISILEHRDQLRKSLNPDLLDDVINTATHYLISRLIIDSDITTKSSLLVGNERFVVNIDINGSAYVYVCKLCEKSCMNITIPSDSNGCALFHEIRRLGIWIRPQSPLSHQKSIIV
ncbi:hypothetical protein [Vulcanisaeta souniana]|nr:hypothetical protein [Vulcanisaeta souniana]